MTQIYKNLKKTYSKLKIDPANIYNVDETALTTVQAPAKIIAETGAKQVRQITLAEHRVLITMIGAISAIENSIPLLLVFLRKYYKDHMLNGAPVGSVGCANTSGWSNSEIFMDWLQHFKKHARASMENQVLLLMDNYKTHLTAQSLEFSEKNGIVLLTFPPHCSNKLQPLDISVYGPLKTYYNAKCGNCMINKPGRKITLYEVSEILGESYTKAFTLENAIAGFQKTGIYPFNDDIFKEVDFLPSIAYRPIVEKEISS